MNGVFNKIVVQKPDYSWFDMSYDHKTTMNMGNLYPVHIQECLPSDKWEISAEGLFRFQALIAPVMHKVDIFVHHFFVPNRIMWKNWEKFITKPHPTSVQPTFPTLSGMSTVVTEKSLANYLGVPLGTYSFDPDIDAEISALPFLAYQKIWWEYFRDQNLQFPTVDTFDDFLTLTDGGQSGANTAKLLAMRKRAWEHDYFTSCLPFAQKGAEVYLPVEVTSNIDVPVKLTPDPTGTQTQLIMDQDGTTPYAPGVFEETGVDTDSVYKVHSGIASYNAKLLDPNGTYRAQGLAATTAVSTTINELRSAYALQKWLEKNARGGTRYTESLLIHWGVRSSDARLQRPEYLGGSKCTMAISEVLQTSESASTAQGNMAGHGISVMGGKQCSYWCEEHGYIMTLCSIRPKTSYYQGLPKHFQKFDRFDYYWPEFAMLGEDVVKNKELMLKFGPGAGAHNEGTFGYLPRYSEYRYNSDRISGEIQSTMEHWSLHRKFDPLSPPALNDQFITCDPSTRIFAVDPAISDEMVCHLYFDIKGRRPLPKYGNPGGIL